MSEDELAKDIIRVQPSPPIKHHYTEVHYNHYGSRGVVDLVTVAGYGHTTTVRELKSEHAVEKSTGANEILRQFNKQQSYFKKGVEDSRIPTEDVRHKLIFEATQKTIEHVVDNISLYGNPNQSGSVLIWPTEGDRLVAVVADEQIQMSDDRAWLTEYLDPAIDAVNDTRGGGND